MKFITLSMTVVTLPLMLLLSAWSSGQNYTPFDEASTEQAAEDASTEDTTALNTLTSAEKTEGWKLLFNGTDLTGWRNYNKEGVGKNWVIADGAIHLNAENKGQEGYDVNDGGDLLFDEAFENYELRLDWKIGACGNSGIIFNVLESADLAYPWLSGPEMQVLDNSCHPDAKIIKHRAGDLYDLITSEPENVHPAGEWNSIRIRIENGDLTFWQNEQVVVSTKLWTPEWKKMVAGSKFAEMPKFGTIKKGKIVLQDHGDPVWFRNIKIKNLDM